jgi:hypothetical protein
MAATSVVLFAAPSSPLQPTPASAPDAAYRQAFSRWQSQLVKDLRQEWLPLAGLFWLKSGENGFGTDPKNNLVFPKGPAHAGSVALEDQKVTVKFAPGIPAVIAGKPAAWAELQPDTSGNPTLVELGTCVCR